MRKTWGGRFDGETSPALSRINDSLAFDRRLIRHDIRGSLAHVAMLGRRGILPEDEVAQIETALRTLLDDVAAGATVEGAEDVHGWVEAELIRRIGPIGGKLHTARSRNDQVATDLRLWLRDAIDDLSERLAGLADALLDRAEEHAETILPSYTHLQRAQPVTLGHHMLAYVEMIRRDAGRFEDARRRLNQCPLGSSAATGTGFPIDRDDTAAQLEFDGPTRNSLDGVASRDFVLETLSAAAILMTNLSRFAEEIVLWTSSEFGFATLDDAVSTGSSIMPQKRNPDGAELVRGKVGRVVGHLTALLTTVKGLPLAYNKDLQEDKEGLFDTIDTLRDAIDVTTVTVATVTFHPEKMAAACRGGFLLATELADALARTGRPFREAHELVGRIVRHAEKSGRGLEELTPEDLAAVDPTLTPDLLGCLDLRAAIDSRDHVGGTAPKRVREEIQRQRSAREPST